MYLYDTVTKPIIYVYVSLSVKSLTFLQNLFFFFNSATSKLGCCPSKQFDSAVSGQISTCVYILYPNVHITNYF